MADDAGQPISYMVLAAGTQCYSADDEMVGTVKQVLADADEDVFDGIVIEAPGGETRFVDGPDVAHIAERRVDLRLTAAEVAALPEHEQGAQVYEPRAPTSGAGEIWRKITLRRLWRRD